MIPRVTLADLTAEELAQEMIRRVPAHTPDWRNVRPGDPGRTLIDLFGWLGETILYRANLTPRRMRLEFLNLLNMKQRPAEAARGLVTLHHKAPQGAAPRFAAAGTGLTGPVPFETTGPVSVLPFEGYVFIKRGLAEAEKAAFAEVIASLADVYDLEAVEPYETQQLFGPRDVAKPEGTDGFAASIDRALWVGLFALEDSDAARGAAAAALDAQPAVLNVGVIPQIVLPDAEVPARDPMEGLSWTVSAPGLGSARIRYLALPVEDDRTRGMTEEGTLRLILPRAAMVAAPPNDIGTEVDAGVGDLPPRIDDPALAARLVCWVRLKADDPAATLPLSWIGINAVTADQRESFGNVLVGTATGQAGMRFDLPARNADLSTLTVSVLEAGKGFQRWEPVDDLGGAGRDDRCYEVDAEAGQILFGDGLTGRGLPAGTRVRLDFLRAGGGEEGNVAAKTLTKVVLPGLVAHQPAAFHDGVAAETLPAAEKRVGAMLHHRNRCVTEDDYRAIVGELGIARTEVLPGFRPYQRGSGNAGVVSVVAIPFKAVQRPENPRPDRRLLDRVHAHLDPRRPLGTELYAISPEYVGIAGSAAITLRDGFAREEVVRAVTDRIYGYLWSLAPGGPDGTGWPLGRAVRNLEIEVEIARVPGVQTTQGVNIFTEGETGFQLVPAELATGSRVLALDLWQLPELLAFDVAVGPGGPATNISLDGAGGTGGPRVGVPVVPEVC